MAEDIALVMRRTQFDPGCGSFLYLFDKNIEYIK